MYKLLVCLIALSLIGCAPSQPVNKDEKQQEQSNSGSNWWLWYWLGRQNSSHTTIHTPSNSGVVHTSPRPSSSSNHISTTPVKTPKISTPSSKPKIPTFGTPRPSSSFSRPAYRSSGGFRSSGFRSGRR